MAPPTDKQQDAGQFNAWLSNLGPSKGGSRPLPQRPPGAAPKPPAQPPQAAKQGGLLGSVDEELDDIFGRITTDDSAPAAPPQVPAASVPRPGPAPIAAPPPLPPRPSQEMPWPSRPQPSPVPRPQQAAPTSLASAPSSAVPQVQAPRPAPRPTAPYVPAAAAPPLSQPMAPAPAQAVSEQIEAAVAEAKSSMQSQIRELQTKYQEQRQKWEKLLADLRARNDELHKRNQELEEELAALRERQRSLIMELSIQRATPQPISLAPQPIEMQQTAPAHQPPPQEEARESQQTEISIEAPQPPGFMGVQPEATFEIPLAKPEVPASGEADDLLAELDALEKEMKNLGGEGQG